MTLSRCKTATSENTAIAIFVKGFIF